MLGLSGIAVGLGARLPNLREQSPSRIAAGFGGTLNLVVSTLYILFVVLLTAVYFAVRTGGALTGRESFRGYLFPGFLTLTAASILLSVAAAGVPLWLGFRAFRKMEF